MKNLKIALAFVLAVFSLPSVACGDYGFYRIQSMNALEFMAFNRVVTGTIVGIQKHPQDTSHLFFTLQIEEQFKGGETVGQIVVDGGSAWKLYGAQVGSKALFFTEMIDGKETLSAQGLSMLVASDFSLKRTLDGLETSDSKWIVDSNKREREKMDKVFKRFRDFAPDLADGQHTLKEYDVVTNVYNIDKGQLHGRFESFTYDGDTLEKGHFMNGERAGTWSVRVAKGEYELVKYDLELAAHTF
jgi:hypothetical protein